MNKTLAIVLSAAFFLSNLALVNPADASVDCKTVYGGGQTCESKGEIDITKTVVSITKGGLQTTQNNPTFQPEDQVTFKIVIKNTGDATFDSVEVKDTFPSYLSFVSGPGSFDANSKVLTFTETNLKAQESRQEMVTGKIAGSNGLSMNQGTICMTNQAIATANGQTDQSNAQFCVQKRITVLPAPKMVQTPPTGPEMLPLMGLIPAGLIGIFLRRKTNAKS